MGWLLENEYPTIVLTRNLEGFSVSMRNHIMRGQKTVVREFMTKMNETDQTEFVKRYWYGWCFDFCVQWAKVVNNKTIPTSIMIDHNEIFSDQIKSIKKILQFLDLEFEDRDILAAVQKISDDPIRSNYSGSK